MYYIHFLTARTKFFAAIFSCSLLQQAQSDTSATRGCIPHLYPRLCISSPASRSAVAALAAPLTSPLYPQLSSHFYQALLVSVLSQCCRSASITSIRSSTICKEFHESNRTLRSNRAANPPIHQSTNPPIQSIIKAAKHSSKRLLAFFLDFLLFFLHFSCILCFKLV